jgi:hypothetical protein
MAQHVPHGTIVDLLALTLGNEKGQSVWIEAVRGLAIPVGDSYTQEQALAVLNALASAPGSTGLAARVARLRLNQDEPPRPASDSFAAVAVPAVRRPRAAPESGDADRPSADRPSVDPGSGPRSSPAETGPSTPPPSTNPPEGGLAGDLLSFLTPSLGDDKAAEALQQYAKSLRLTVAALSRDDAVALLDAMGAAPGLLGVVARFAKVRFVLRHPA